jgi:lysyl-tRNA synthetase class I
MLIVLGPLLLLLIIRATPLPFWQVNLVETILQSVRRQPVILKRLVTKYDPMDLQRKIWRNAEATSLQRHLAFPMEVVER